MTTRKCDQPENPARQMHQIRESLQVILSASEEIGQITATEVKKITKLLLDLERSLICPIAETCEATKPQKRK